MVQQVCGPGTAAPAAAPAGPRPSLIHEQDGPVLPPGRRDRLQLLLTEGGGSAGDACAPGVAQEPAGHSSAGQRLGCTGRRRPCPWQQPGPCPAACPPSLASPMPGMPPPRWQPANRAAAQPGWVPRSLQACSRPGRLRAERPCLWPPRSRCCCSPSCAAARELTLRFKASARPRIQSSADDAGGGMGLRLRAAPRADARQTAEAHACRPRQPAVPGTRASTAWTGRQSCRWRSSAPGRSSAPLGAKLPAEREV